MNFIRFFAAGMIGGLVGAAAWAAVTYFTHWEVGLIAWLVGVMAGVTVRAIAGDELTRTSGAAALIAALLCVGVGKFATGYLYAMHYRGVALTEEESTSFLADVVAREAARIGKQVQWPAGVDPAEAYYESDYPPDIWAEARSRWQKLTAQEQDRYSPYPMLMDTEYLRHGLADKVVEEFRSNGKNITVVEEVRGGEYAHGPDRYPSEVWAEATARWGAMTPDERRVYEQTYIDEVDGIYSMSMPLVAAFATLASLSLWDLLWLGLAGLSAWRIASGSSGIANS